MIKKDITFKDLDGKDVTETYYFSVPPTEIFVLDDEVGGLEQTIKTIVAEQNIPKIVSVLNSLVAKAVGIKDDKNQFKRSKEITESFMGSEAYSALILEFLMDPTSCAEFCVGVIPEALKKKMQESGALETAELPKAKIFPGDYTQQELEAMPKQEFQALLGQMPGKNIPRDLLNLAMRKI